MFKLCVVCVFVIYRIVGLQSRGFLPKNIDVEKTGTCTRSIIDSTHDSQTKQKQRGKKNHLRLCLFFNFFCFCGHFNFSFSISATLNVAQRWCTTVQHWLRHWGHTCAESNNFDFSRRSNILKQTNKEKTLLQSLACSQDKYLSDSGKWTTKSIWSVASVTDDKITKWESKRKGICYCRHHHHHYHIMLFWKQDNKQPLTLQPCSQHQLWRRIWPLKVGQRRNNLPWHRGLSVNFLQLSINSCYNDAEKC